MQTDTLSCGGLPAVMNLDQNPAHMAVIMRILPTLLKSCLLWHHGRQRWLTSKDQTVDTTKCSCRVQRRAFHNYCSPVQGAHERHGARSIQGAQSCWLSLAAAHIDITKWDPEKVRRQWHAPSRCECNVGNRADICEAPLSFSVAGLLRQSRCFDAVEATV